jgi:hypothetical protein
MPGQDSGSSQTPKMANATLYLIEELGDARLRCDQLTRYIAEAVKLINQSEHRDHFFEIAGHLLQGIPETAFKLQKALQAVALAADRIDYEELKLELRPEKVDELEKVLKEVRIHQVQHRSETPMTPKQVATQLRTLAKTARDEGYFPIHEIAALVGKLDTNRVAGAPVSVADVLDKIAESLETAKDKPSRIQLANLLSRVAMESDFDELVRLSSQKSQLSQFSSVEEVKEKFKAENPNISDADLEEIAKQWKANKDVVKDKNAAFLTPKETLTLNFDEIKVLALKALQAAKSERWKPALHSIYFLVDTIGTLLVNMGSMDTVKVEALKREIRELLPRAEESVSNMQVSPAIVTAAATDRLERLVSGIEEQAKEMRHSLDTYNKDPGRYAPQLENLKHASGAITTILRTMDRTLTGMKTASDKDPVIFIARNTLAELTTQLEHDLRGDKDWHDNIVDAAERTLKADALRDRANNLLQRVAASILWMYTDEDGKDFYLSSRRRGTIRSPYTGKTFTADAKRATMGEVGKELKEDEVKIKGSLWKYVDGDDNEFYLPERLTTTLRSPTTGKTFKPKAERFTLSEVGKNLREEGKKASATKWDKAKTKRWMEREVVHHIDRKTDEVNNTSLAEAAAHEFDIYEDSKDYNIPEDLFDLSLSVGESWEKKNKKASSEDDAKRSRFEEGKPADPTENMDPEDAKKWKSNTDEYGDKFKSAADDERTASADILAWKA